MFTMRRFAKALKYAFMVIREVNIVLTFYNICLNCGFRRKIFGVANV